MDFNFSNPLWLLGLLVLPLVIFFSSQTIVSNKKLEAFIDKHLLPYLLMGKGERKYRKNLILWSLVWTFLMIALAGPRFSYREVEILVPDQNLVIALDLSESMNASDVKPTRLKLAKLKIEDVINDSNGAKIGLIAFAKDPHMISPLTDDKSTLRSFLPSISTDIISIQGSRLTETLEMAFKMLAKETGKQKEILLITDGGFEDSSAFSKVQELKNRGITLHIMGMGSPEGTLLKNAQGNILKKKGTAVLSKLETEKLMEMAKIGEGRYYSYLEDFNFKPADVTGSEGKKTIWEEHFYLFIFPIIPVFLMWFRRGYLFIFLFTIFELKADYFKNSQEQAKLAFDSEDYKTACDLFEDPYQKGVCYYRLGEFEKAEAMFSQSEEGAYNLGNSLAKQLTKEKLVEAVKAYEKVLQKNPDHTNAKENLEIVKKLLEKEKEQEPDSQDKDENQNQEDKPSPSDSKDQKESQSQNESKEESQKDQNADMWLNRIQNDPKAFLKNKCYFESMRNGMKEEVDPW